MQSALPALGVIAVCYDRCLVPAETVTGFGASPFSNVSFFQQRPLHGGNGDDVLSCRLARFRLPLPARAISIVLCKPEIHEEAR